MERKQRETAVENAGESRVRNAVLVVLVCLMMAGPALLGAAQGAGLPLPTWITTQEASYLSGGISESKVADHLSVEGFASKQLQGALEDAVGNNVPAKSAALLGNAALQRSAIQASNALFGWPIYPTYFGSERLVNAQANALTYLPTAATAERTKLLESFAQGLSSAAERHPEQRFAMYLVQGYETPAVNPAYGLVPYAPLTAQDCAQAVEGALGQAPGNLVFLTRSYENATDYYQHFFRSDHHWNAAGAIAAYNQMAQALGLGEFTSPGKLDFGSYRYSGATARWGLSTLDEEVSDTAFDFSHLVVEAQNGSTRPFDHSAFEADTSVGKRYLFYDEYFSWTINDGDTLVNTAGGNGKNALVVADSYIGALQHILANEYDRTTVTWGLGGWDQEGGNSLEELLATGDYDDVFFVASPMDFSTFAGRNPAYFD